MKYIPLHPIITGEETVLATFWQRFWAIMIDIIIAGIIFDIIVHIFIRVGVNLTNVNFHIFQEVEVTAEGLNGAKTKLIKGVLASIPTLYFALSNYFTNGKTIGKRIMRIRVVSLYHHRISFWHCVERALGYIASGLEAGLGFLQVFWNPNRMCLHDRIAETIVIQEKKREKKK